MPAGAAAGDALRTVHTADGKELEVKGYLPNARLRVGEFSCSISMPVLQLAPGMDAILGKPWLTRVNPSIDWQCNTVTFEWRGAVQQWHCTAALRLQHNRRRVFAAAGSDEARVQQLLQLFAELFQQLRREWSR